MNNLKNMNDFEEMKSDIIRKLQGITYKGGDFGDLGNEVGFVLGKYTMNETAFEDSTTTQAFIDGFKHGVSLTDGTH